MSQKRSSERSLDLSSYRKCVLASLSGQSRRRRSTQESKEAQPGDKMKHESKELIDQERARHKTSRWTPNTFAASSRAFINSRTSCPGTRPDAHRLSRSPPASQNEPFRTTAKDAFSRFFRSARRTFTFDLPNSKSGRSSRLLPNKKQKSGAKVRPTISHPMKLHHSGFGFSAARETWAYEAASPRPAALLTRHSTPHFGPQTRPGWPLERPYTALNQAIHSRESELVARPSAPEPTSTETYEALSRSSGEAPDTYLMPIFRPPSQSTDSSRPNNLRASDEDSWMNFIGAISPNAPHSSDPEPPVMLRPLIRSSPYRHSSSTQSTPAPESEKCLVDERWEPSCFNTLVLRDLNKDEWYSDLIRSIERTNV